MVWKTATICTCAIGLGLSLDRAMWVPSNKINADPFLKVMKCMCNVSVSRSFKETGPQSRCASSKSVCGLLQTVHDGRIYQLKLTCGSEYPDKVGGVLRVSTVYHSGCCNVAFSLKLLCACVVQPPTVRFVTRINMPCVTPSGQVGCPSSLSTKVVH